jgi:hypothetical protein
MKILLQPVTVLKALFCSRDSLVDVATSYGLGRGLVRILTGARYYPFSKPGLGPTQTLMPSAQLHRSTKMFVPRTSIGELNSTFYAESRYVYRSFPIMQDFKDTEEFNVQNVLYVLMKQAKTIL